MVTITGSYEGKTLQITHTITSPYTATATDEMIQGYGGADTIYGNGLDNYIFGDQRGDRSDFDLTPDGADTLYGYGGNDFLDPGAGVGNFVDGGIGTDTLDYRYATPGQTVTIDMDANLASAGTYGTTTFLGIENIYGSLNGVNIISGDEQNNEIHGGILDDVITGGYGDDTIFGSIGNDDLRGGSGSDTIEGGNGHDTMFGSTGHDRIVGNKGADAISGGKGGDTLIGGHGGDFINGNKGGDYIYGKNGKDTLVAGTGADKLWGGAAADRFVFENNWHYNQIMDFESKDTIQIGSGASKYSQLKFTDTNAGLLIEFGKTDVFLKGLDIGDIDQSNFDFV